METSSEFYQTSYLIVNIWNPMLFIECLQYPQLQHWNIFTLIYLCANKSLLIHWFNVYKESRSPHETGDVTQMLEKDGIKDKILSKNDLDHSLLQRELTRFDKF